MMDPLRVHLMLNHLSIVGSMFALALLVVAIAKPTRELITVAFACTVAVALVSLPVYFTGQPAQARLKQLPDVSIDSIRAHEDTAQYAFTGIECLGVLAVAGLLLFRREPVPRWFLGIMIAGSVLTVAAMYYTGDRGRRIRHLELEERFSITRFQMEDSCLRPRLGRLSVRHESPAKCLASSTI